MNQHRKFSRLPFKTASTLYFENTAQGIAGNLIDLSFKGALVEAPPEFEGTPGQPVTLKIELEDSNVVIEMQAEVAHREAGRIGLHCVSIDLESMTHLRRVMELNLGDPGLLERELLNLG